MGEGDSYAAHLQSTRRRCRRGWTPKRAPPWVERGWTPLPFQCFAPADSTREISTVPLYPSHPRQKFDFACPREAGRLRRLRGPAKNARGQQKTKVSVEHGATVHMFEWDAGESTPVSLLADARGLWGQHGRVDGWARGPRRDALGHRGEKVFVESPSGHGLKKRWKQLRECHRMNDRISLDKPSESGMRPSIPKKFFRVFRAEIKPRKTSSEFDGILRNSRGFLRTDKTLEICSLLGLTYLPMVVPEPSPLSSGRR